jgi:hypothetical protein
MVAAMASAEWRYVICDEDGRARFAGITRARPADGSDQSRRDPRRGGIVELQMTQAQLRDLITRQDTQPGTTRPDNVRQWAAVVADIRRQANRELKREPHLQADPICSDDIRRRQARAALRRWIQVRGRVCSAPGCRVPGIKTDQDHLIDWIIGGPTTEANLSLVCRHDHRAKHEGGWRVTMPGPGLIIWTSPLGHTYLAQPPPIMPTPPHYQSVKTGQRDVPRPASPARRQG